jgi:transposase InsO family protein
MYTSWVEAESLRTITAEETCRAFFRIIIARHGFPSKVLTDQGKQFTSKFFNWICNQFKIEYLESTAYHHQTNGKIERFHKFLENSLSTIIKPED